MQMCLAFRRWKVLAHSQRTKMPQSLSVVSMEPSPRDHLLPWTKQLLSFTMLCRRKIFCKMTSTLLKCITSKDLASQGISSSETSVDFHISITIWCGCMSFLVVYATFSEGDCFLRQCF